MIWLFYSDMECDRRKRFLFANNIRFIRINKPRQDAVLCACFFSIVALLIRKLSVILSRR
jgi:hypothetical protein